MSAPEHYPVEHRAASGAEETIVLLHGGNIANWSWAPQVDGLTDFHVLTPHHPGFGALTGERWESLQATADEVADLIRERAIGGRAHVVGLSLGGIVATRLLARHPDTVRTALVTGVAGQGVQGLTRHLGFLQLRAWDRRWFWQAQARVFGLPAQDRELFVTHGLSVTRDNASRMLREVYDGQLPAGLARYDGPLLAVAGEKEDRSVRTSFASLRELVPRVECRIAPGMHHAWSIEDVDLFNDMVRGWVRGEIDGRLLPA